MRRVLSVLAVLALAGCAAGNGAGEEPPTTDGQIEPGTFISTAVTEDDRPRPLVNGARIELTVTDDEIAAYAGCNHLSGRYQLDAGALVVSDLVTTDMACDDALQEQDTWLAEFLGARPAARPDGDDLVLHTDTTEIQFSRQR